MISQQLKEATIRAWIDFGEAVKKAFGFKGFIEASPVIKILNAEDEEKVEQFLEYIKEQTKALEEMD